MVVQLGNAIAVWAQVVAVQWVLTAQGRSALVVSLAPAALSLPFLALALPLGVVVSYASRERLMAGAMLASAVAAAAAWALTATGQATPTALILSVAAVGVSLVCVGVAWQSLLPETVEKRAVASAAIVDAAAFNSARAAGPIAAGAVLALAGPAHVFAGTTALFALCAAGLLVATVGRPSRRAPRQPIMRSTAAAVRFAAHSPWTRRLLLRMVLFGVPSSCLWATLSLVVHDRLHLGSGGFGLMMGMIGVGAVLGTLALTSLRGRMSVNGFAVLGSAAYAAVLAVLATVGSVPVVAAFLVLGGAAWVGVQSTWMQLGHQALPFWVRPRIIAMILFLFQGTQALGALLWGAAVDLVGLRTAILLAATVMALSAVGLLRRGLYPSAGIEPEPAVGLVTLPTPPGAATSGDVMVEVNYRVAPTEEEEEFFTAMQRLRLSRLRLGARRWTLFTDPSRPGQYVECYVVGGWTEYVAQETDRLTVPERQLRDRVATLADVAEPRVLVEARPASRRQALRSYVHDPAPSPNPETGNPDG
jgi:MFS family permease